MISTKSPMVKVDATLSFPATTITPLRSHEKGHVMLLVFLTREKGHV